MICFNSFIILKEDSYVLSVLVNGKVRATIDVNVSDSEDVIKQKAKNAENVQKHIDGKEIVKIIVIKNKIVNIVVR